MNEWISEITRGPSGSVRHAVSLFKLNNSTTYSQQESKSLPSLMNLDKREYCSYTSNIFKNTLYPVLPLTILHMKNNFSPNSHFWNLAWKPSLYGSSDDSSPTLLLAPFFCLFVRLSHCVVSLGLTSFIFILSSHYSDSASSRKAEAWCPQLSLFLDSRKTRERQKKLQTNIFHPIYSQIYFQDVFPYAGLENVLSFDHSRRGKAVCLYLT